MADANANATEKPKMFSAAWRAAMEPWTCDTCGQKNIGADKWACPKCYVERPDSETARAARLVTEAVHAKAHAGEDVEMRAGQATRIYEGEQALREGIDAMARQGWRVVSQTPYQPRAGVGRTLALGVVGAALIKPKMKWSVVFERMPA